ncbi:hypothetical protein A2U01_0038053, partial [Trifolium medium]|nr:hypothetical protein [Trifolium medium]
MNHLQPELQRRIRCSRKHQALLKFLKDFVAFMAA